jgi:hypothetical protein
MKTWTERIRQYATVHYTEDGWDILVENWTDEYINDVVRGCKTYEDAIIKCFNIVAFLDSVRSESRLA